MLLLALAQRWFAVLAHPRRLGPVVIAPFEAGGRLGAAAHLPSPRMTMASMISTRSLVPKVSKTVLQGATNVANGMVTRRWRPGFW